MRLVPSAAVTCCLNISRTSGTPIDLPYYLTKRDLILAVTRKGRWGGEALLDTIDYIMWGVSGDISAVTGDS